MANDPLERLWAPWRLEYVSAEPGPKPDCFLCAGLAADEDRKHLIVERTPHAVVVLNLFPYNNGHLLIAPRAHKAELADLADEETLDLQRTLTRMVGHLQAILEPDGFNVGLNLGRAAGAGLPGHLHWHVVPRWNGDTNFMPVLGGTKVIAQSLEALYDLLRDRIAAT